jgi:hypothetical protein
MTKTWLRQLWCFACLSSEPLDLNVIRAHLYLRIRWAQVVEMMGAEQQVPSARCSDGCRGSTMSLV